MVVAMLPATPDPVHEAYRKIKRHVNRTPVLTSPTLSHMMSTKLHSIKPGLVKPDIELFFKAENMQRTGSFKFRGALNSIISLPEMKLANGLATTSSGNHAKGLAAAASELAESKHMSIPVWAVMPENAVVSKMRAVEAMGATVITSGSLWAQRSDALMSVCRDTGATLISSDSNPNVLTGQGTVGVEFVDQLEHDFDVDLSCIIAPCGTGGILSGLALAFKDKDTKVFGVEPAQGADDAARGRKLGSRIKHVESASIADGLRSPVSPLAWEIIRDEALVEDIFRVSEEQIVDALRLAATELKVVIEPSAAVGLAAVLFNDKLHRAVEKMPQPCKVGVVFTGGNVDCPRLGAFLK